MKDRGRVIGQVDHNQENSKHLGKPRVSRVKVINQSIAGPSHQQDSRQDKSPTEGSRHEGSGQFNKARETKTTKNGTNRAAERRPVRSKQATAVRPCPYYLRSLCKTTRRISRGVEEYRNGKYPTEQYQEKEPQDGSLRWRSSG
ncbi:uncharacterized protein TNCV_3765331 [Trichonephila clavipes]|nr:uncharacterized protein TNCV_3765331 [Trichonephila clavipes]